MRTRTPSKRRTTRKPPAPHPPQIDEGAPPPHEALRLVAGLQLGDASRLIQAANTGEGWLRQSRYIEEGRFWFPVDEFKGLNWPGLVVRVIHERGSREIYNSLFVVFADADGDYAVSTIRKVPTAEKRITTE